jgi:hypothetical protein
MKDYLFNLNLSRQQYLPYYSGQISSIVVTTIYGQRVQFPASHLRSYVSNAGISGFFCLKTKNNKFFSLTKLAN